MIGPPVAGLLPLLIGNERVLWRPDDPDELAELVGVGLLARTLREPDRYREVVMVAPDRSSILVLPRLTSAHGVHGAREFGGTVVRPEDPSEQVVSDDMWDEFGRGLSDVFVAASTRSEFIVIEMNTPEFSNEPYVLAIVLTDTTRRSSISNAAPVPTALLCGHPGVFRKVRRSRPRSTGTASRSPDRCSPTRSVPGASPRMASPSRSHRGINGPWPSMNCDATLGLWNGSQNGLSTSS